MSFEYPYTCPNIDSNISDAQVYIKDLLDSILTDCCPLLQHTPKIEYIEYWAKLFYQDLERVFEDTRATNINMREEAERQIKILVDANEDLEDDLAKSNTRIEELEYENGQLERQIEELQQRISF